MATEDHIDRFLERRRCHSVLRLASRALARHEAGARERSEMLGHGLTRDGQLLGTLHYLAPELIEGGPATSASDIYALGCLLYESVTAAPPFGDRRDAELAYAHLAEPPPDPCAQRPGLPADLGLALLTALAKNPRERPSTATALARMLHLAGTPAPA